MQELKDYERFHSKSKLEKSVNTLKGLITGISIDGVISGDEMNELLNWCSLQAEFRDKEPYSELIPLIEAAMSDGKIDAEECSDILWVCNNFISRNDYFDYVTASIQQLHGIIHGVLADNKIDDAEIVKLTNWIELNDFLRGTYPYDELDSLLASILADHVVSEDERLQLKAFLSDFIDPSESFNINLPEIEDLRAKIHISGVCAACPDIVFPAHSFCFTGASSRADRATIVDVVTDHGGIFADNVTRKTNYLVVGSDGNPCWAFACYGRKVEKAVQLRRDGNPIIIVHENDFWDAI